MVPACYIVFSDSCQACGVQKTARRKLLWLVHNIYYLTGLTWRQPRAGPDAPSLLLYSIPQNQYIIPHVLTADLGLDPTPPPLLTQRK